MTTRAEFLGPDPRGDRKTPGPSRPRPRRVPRIRRRPRTRSAASSPSAGPRRSSGSAQEFERVARRLPSRGDLAEVPALIGASPRERGARSLVTWHAAALGFDLGAGARRRGPRRSCRVPPAPATRRRDGAIARGAPAAELGLTGVDLAIAETGTLILLSGAGRPRSTSLLPPRHVAVFDRRALVESLEQVGVILEACTPIPTARCRRRDQLHHRPVADRGHRAHPDPRRPRTQGSARDLRGRPLGAERLAERLLFTPAEVDALIPRLADDRGGVIAAPPPGAGARAAGSGRSAADPGRRRRRARPGRVEGHGPSGSTGSRTRCARRSRRSPSSAARQGPRDRAWSTFPPASADDDGQSLLEARRERGALLARPRRGLRAAEAAAMTYRAVLFDLFDTLVIFDRERLPEIQSTARPCAPPAGTLHEALRPFAPQVGAGRLRRALGWSWQEAERIRPWTTARWRRPSASRICSGGSARPAALPPDGDPDAARTHMRELSRAVGVPAHHRAAPARLRSATGSPSCRTSTTRPPRARHPRARGRRRPLRHHRRVGRGRLAQAAPSSSRPRSAGSASAPAEALFVGDRVDIDVVGAQAVGMPAAGSTASGEPLPPASRRPTSRSATWGSWRGSCGV